MTPQQIKAMKLALGALEKPHPGVRTNFSDAVVYRESIKEAITALEEVLAEHAMRETQRLGQEIEQELVAYPDGDVVGPCICGSWPGGKCLKCPRITTPPQRKPLTEEQIEQLEQDTCAMEFPETVRAIEAAHGIKGDA